MCKCVPWRTRCAVFPPSSMAPVFSLPLWVRAPTRAHDLALFLCPWTRLFASVCPSVKCGCVEPPGIPPCSAHGGLIWEGCSVLWVFTGGCGVTVVPGSWGGGTFSLPVPEHGKFHELSLLSQGRGLLLRPVVRRSIRVRLWSGSFPSVDLTVLP